MPKAKTGGAAMRAWRSWSPASRSIIKKKWKATQSGPVKRAQKVAYGGAIRRGRIKHGLNPNTGSTYTAKQLGLSGKNAKTYRGASQATKKGLTAHSSAGKRGTRGVRKNIKKTVRQYRKR